MLSPAGRGWVSSVETLTCNNRGGLIALSGVTQNVFVSLDGVRQGGQYILALIVAQIIVIQIDVKQLEEFVLWMCLCWCPPAPSLLYAYYAVTQMHWIFEHMDKVEDILAMSATSV